MLTSIQVKYTQTLSRSLCFCKHYEKRMVVEQCLRCPNFVRVVCHYRNPYPSLCYVTIMIFVTLCLLPLGKQATIRHCYDRKKKVDFHCKKNKFCSRILYLILHIVFFYHLTRYGASLTSDRYLGPSVRPDTIKIFI